MERPPLRRRPRSHDAAPAPSRDDVRDQVRLPRSRRSSWRPPTADQGVRARRRTGRSDFDTRVHTTLAELGIDVEIEEQPFGLPMTTPFPEDVEHASWDPEAIERFGRILDWTDTVFEEFSGWFNGKTSPVHLFWHGLDLAVTRFSGRAGMTIDADPGQQGGLLTRGRVVRLLGGRRHRRRRHLLLLHRARARGTSRATASGGQLDRVRHRAHWRCCPTKPCAAREIRERRCLRSARARTRPALALPAGTPPASNRNGVRPPGS